MADFSELKKRLLSARQQDLDNQEMGEDAAPTAMGAVVDYAGEQAGQNLDASNNIVAKAAAMHGKMVDNQNYQPTPEELENQDAYGKMMTGAVAGSIAPEGGVLPNKPTGAFGSSLFEKEAQAKALRDSMYDTLPNMSEKNLLKQKFANQKASRAMDQADRARKFDTLKSKLGR